MYTLSGSHWNIGGRSMASHSERLMSRFLSRKLLHAYVRGEIDREER
jgi:hypothetical protein